MSCHPAASLPECKHPLCLQDLEQDAELVRVGTQAHQDSILLEAQLHGLQQGQEREAHMLQAAEHHAQGLRDEHELHASQVGGLPSAGRMCCRPARTQSGLTGGTELYTS